MSDYVTDPELLKQLNGGYVTDPALLAQLNAPQRPMEHAKTAGARNAPLAGADLPQNPSEPGGPQTVEEWKRRSTDKYIKENAGFMENLGAGVNSAWQGTKQLLGLGAKEADIAAMKELEKKMAAAQFGGGATQVAGSMLATAPLVIGAGEAGAAGLTAAAASKLPYAARAAEAALKAGDVGGRYANLGNVARGSLEGGLQAGLEPVTSKESRPLNVAMGTVAGAVLPAALGTAGAVKRFVSPTEANAAYRASQGLNKELGPTGIQGISEALDLPGAQTRLPLTVAGRTGNPNLARLERGARARTSGEESLAYPQDKAVAEEAWNWMQEATGTSKELPSRLADREATLAALREQAGATPFNASKFEKAQTTAMNAITAAREHPSGQILADPTLSKELSHIQTLVTLPDATPHFFETAADRVMKLAQGDVTPQARGVLKDLEGQIRAAGDTVSSGTTSLIKPMYQAESDFVKQAQAAKDIRETFKSPEGVVLTRKSFGETPSLEAGPVSNALAKHGEELVGTESRKVLAPQDWQSAKNLADELRRNELYKAGMSPGETALERNNPANIAFSGINNPLNKMPAVKGAINWLTGGAFAKTQQAADKAVMSPEAWKKMVATAEKFKNVRGPTFDALPQKTQMMIELLRSGVRLPANISAANLGD